MNKFLTYHHIYYYMIKSFTNVSLNYEHGLGSRTRTESKGQRTPSLVKGRKGLAPFDSWDAVIIKTHELWIRFIILVWHFVVTDFGGVSNCVV